MKLLIVEDHPAMRRFIKSLLDDLAEQATECEDGIAALSEYARVLPDWVLMDVQMPCLDGLAASRQILAQYPEARICLVSRHNDRATRKAAQQIGVRAFVSKSNLFELREVLQSAAWPGRRQEN